MMGVIQGALSSQDTHAMGEIQLYAGNAEIINEMVQKYAMMAIRLTALAVLMTVRA